MTGFLTNLTLKEIVEDAERRRIALGHFNVSNLEQLKAVVSAAQKLKVPVVIGVSEGEREFMGTRQIAALLRVYREDGAPVFLNADHTHSLEKVCEAAEAGFDAVLFDGGKLPFRENAARTKEAVKLARKINKKILVEGELGYIGSGSTVFKNLPKGAAKKSEDFTKPEDALRFVRETGIDMLAPAVGNIHGMFQDIPNPNLDIRRIREIRASAGVPLVLHGGSGIRNKDFLAAIDAGISIIHISTELRVAWRKGLESSLKRDREEVAPYKLLGPVLEKVERVTENRLKLFNKLLD